MDKKLSIKNNEFREKVKNNKNIVDDYETNEIKLIKKPMGKILFNHGARKKNRQIVDMDGYVTCAVCSKKYTQKNSTNHRKTEKHKLYEKMNEKMRDLMI